MGVKDVMKSFANQGYLVGRLDRYLLAISDKDSDRAIDVNAPSQLGGCLRARYYARTGEQSDGSIDARVRRIFDNGTHFHIRTQEYLMNMGVLLMDEIPVSHNGFNIQGHTDGLFCIEDLTQDELKAIKLNKWPIKNELAVLELKSMRQEYFDRLKEANHEHKIQGLCYTYCLEERRKELRKIPKDTFYSLDNQISRKFKYMALYTHLKNGSKHTRTDKMIFQVGLHMKLDEILYRVEKPITKCTFLYESKNTQNLKEFTISMDDEESMGILNEMLADCTYLNECVYNEQIPDRPEGNTKSCPDCRFCNYKIACWK